MFILHFWNKVAVNQSSDVTIHEEPKPRVMTRPIEQGSLGRRFQVGTAHQTQGIEERLPEDLVGAQMQLDYLMEIYAIQIEHLERIRRELEDWTLG